jgi:hypothetical protein
MLKNARPIEPIYFSKYKNAHYTKKLIKYTTFYVQVYQPILNNLCMYRYMYFFLEINVLKFVPRIFFARNLT